MTDKRFEDYVKYNPMPTKEIEPDFITCTSCDSDFEGIKGFREQKIKEIKRKTYKRFIRNIFGEVYDVKNGKFYQEDFIGKPIGYEDDVVKLLNELDSKNQHIKDSLQEAYDHERTALGKSVLKQLLESLEMI